MRSIRTILVILLAITVAAFCYTEIRKISTGREVGPVISCPEGVLEVSVNDPESAYLKGITAKDEQDGDITEKLLVGGVSNLIKNNTAKVTYFVFDSDDNMSSCVRTIEYTDYKRPEIKVSSPLHFATGETADIISKLTAFDHIDGDISDKVRISTLATTSHSQIYTVTAQVTNSLGDTVRIDLPVIYRDSIADRPVIELKEQLVYVSKGENFDPMEYLSGVTVRGESVDVSNIYIENETNTNEQGNYWVWYTYTNGDHEGISVLTVVVR